MFRPKAGLFVVYFDQCMGLKAGQYMDLSHFSREKAEKEKKIKAKSQKNVIFWVRTQRLVKGSISINPKLTQIYSGSHLGEFLTLTKKLNLKN